MSIATSRVHRYLWTDQAARTIDSISDLRRKITDALKHPIDVRATVLLAEADVDLAEAELTIRTAVNKVQSL